MNHSTPSPICNRESDLVSFLYQEASEAEVHEFEIHLQQCLHCQKELASFGMVRESISAWKDEALGGFVSQPVPTPVKEKSAFAALRQFFDLSPLWLKGAVGFAAVLFCVLAFLAFSRPATKPEIQETVVVTGRSEAEVKEILEKARAEWNEAARRKLEEEHKAVQMASASERPRVVPGTKKGQSAKRTPLSRSEREELAVDLRLLSSPDEGLNLLSDRMNQ